jgi:hypothetical protein
MLAALFHACILAFGSTALPAQARANPIEQVVDTATVLKGGDNAIRHVVRETVRDSVRWRAIRDSLFLRHLGPPIPDVDFRRYMLVVAVGPTALPGDSVIVQPIIQADRVTKVRVTVYYQPCTALNSETMPFHILRIPRTDTSPRFEDQVVHNPKCD